MKWFWLGAFVVVAAIMLDTNWHAHTGKAEAGIPPFHFLWMAGVATMVTGAVLTRKAGRSPKWVMNLFLLATIVAATGSIWDNFFNHLIGIEPGMFDPPHVTLNGGSLLSMVLALLTFILKNKSVSERTGMHAG
jgi:hypothetical protein